VRLAENRPAKGPTVKLKTLFSAGALALLAACTGDGPTEVQIPTLVPLPAGTPIVTNPSGLKYAEITVGTGTLAANGSVVFVHYTGWLAADGTGFDSSAGQQPFGLRLGEHEVIPGFEEGIVGMKVGGKRRLFIPAALGYGATAVYDGDAKVIIPANSDLVFDVELVSVQ
jgi:FKBP-type peptidyl-prolyl cis-trans isomerase